MTIDQQQVNVPELQRLNEAILLTMDAIRRVVPQLAQGQTMGVGVGGPAIDPITIAYLQQQALRSVYSQPAFAQPWGVPFGHSFQGWQHGFTQPFQGWQHPLSQGFVPPYMTQPFATQPFGTQPFGTQPFATQPFGTQPFATQPFATQPFTHFGSQWQTPYTTPFGAQPITPWTSSVGYGGMSAQRPF